MARLPTRPVPRRPDATRKGAPKVIDKDIPDVGRMRVEIVDQPEEL